MTAAAPSHRWSALAGAGFFALVMGFASLTSGMPTATDPPQEVVTYLVDEAERLQAAAALYGLAMPLALCFVAGLVGDLRAANGGRVGAAVVALSGGVLAAASSVVAALVLGTAANRADDLGADVAAALWTMFLLGFGATLLGLLLVIGATAVTSVRSRLLPRWLTVASALLAVASVVGATTIGYDAAGLQVVAGLAIVLDSVWILVVSVHQWRRRLVTEPPAVGPDARALRY